MVKPSVHLNGTPRQRLLDAYCEAGEAVRKAMEAVHEAGPNGRDYYLQGDGVINLAGEEHRARIEALSKVLADMQELALHVDRAGR